MPAWKQVAAIPLRWNGRGKVEVLLVTSRETRRWVVPKGWPLADRSAHEAAANEAWEEAGVRGHIHTRKVGTFTYEKRLRDEERRIKVAVFLLAVTEVAEAWPEAGERERAWFSPAKAAAAVAEPELKAILLGLRD